MKLLYYSHSFAPNIGGIETITMSLARGLADRRGANGEHAFEVTLATQTAAGEFDDRPLPFRVVRRPGLARLYNSIRAADVVHIAGPALAPLVLAWMARKPVVIEHHGYQAICPNGLLVQQPGAVICPGHFRAGEYKECLRCRAAETSWFRSVAEMLAMFPRHLLAQRATRNVAISRYEEQRLLLPNAGVIYHGVEGNSGAGNGINQRLAETSASASSSEGPGADKKIRFAYVGRLVPEKGLPVLLKAAEILRSDAGTLEILLIGDGPEKQRLENIVRQRGLESLVRCTGFLRGVGLADELDRVDVVVMPSAWEETAGLAAIEQMMRGRLVIASRIGGLAEIVGDGGLTFEAGNAEELALCMRRVLENPGQIQTIGRAARERAHKLFPRDRMIAEHARLYCDALNARIE
jgi:glycosyltransferase involved in cell wall biosynthesis